MSYFVTGATGFIGRHLVERVLEREGDIYVLVREESQEKLEALRERWGAGDRIKPVVGDLSQPLLGVSEEDRQTLAGVEHFFHLAAIYDMTADEERNRRLNVNGTQHARRARQRARRGPLPPRLLDRGRRRLRGPFHRGQLRRGPEAPEPKTKYEAEKLVRQSAVGRWRVYRPSVVVGNSKTGEMDKIDGPYDFFKAIQKARGALPQWFPLVGLEVGKTNIVPVDYVAAAMDHIAHLPDLDGQAFHLVDPKMRKAGDVINIFAQAGHAPKMVLRVDKKMTAMLPKGVLSYAMKLPALKDIRRQVLSDFGIPDSILEHIGLKPTFDARDTKRALSGSGIELPPLEDYADKLIHMPLVRTPMIAPSKIYDSFPTISPEEAADLVCEAIRSKPKQINTRLGTFGEVAYALAPMAVDQILHMAYKVFLESTKKKEGEKDGPGDRASGEAMALAHLMKGVHW